MTEDTPADDREPPMTGPAVTDAQAVLRRIREDEDDARRERDRLREAGLVEAADLPAGDLALEHDEQLIDVRTAVVVHGVNASGSQLTGRLHLTTRRLVLAGRDSLAIPLETIDEVSLVGEQLLVALADGTGVRINLGRPRVFRVRLAYAIGIRRDRATRPDGAAAQLVARPAAS